VAEELDGDVRNLEGVLEVSYELSLNIDRALIKTIKQDHDKCALLHHRSYQIRHLFYVQIGFILEPLVSLDNGCNQNPMSPGTRQLLQNASHDIRRFYNLLDSGGIRSIAIELGKSSPSPE
jgi:hypothetical protein